MSYLLVQSSQIYHALLTLRALYRKDRQRQDLHRRHIFFFSFFHVATLTETFETTYDEVMPRTHLKNPKFTLLSETTSIPATFICESSPTNLMFPHSFINRSFRGTIIHELFKSGRRI